MRTLLILLILALPVSGWGAVYYVSPTGSNTSPYDTWAKAANLPSTAVTHGNSVAGPHTIYIAPGVYASNIILTDADWSGGVVSGVSATGVAVQCVGNVCDSYPATKGEVVLNSTSNILQISQNSTIKNITGTGTTATTGPVYVTAGLVTLSNIHIYNTVRLVYQTGGSLTISSSTFGGNTDSTRAGVQLTSASNFTSKQSIYGTYGNYPLSNVAGFEIGTTGTVYIDNNIIYGTVGRTINQSSAATTTIRNSIILAPWTADAYTVYRSTGTINENNNLVMSGFGGNYPARNAYGLSLNSSDILDQNPKWKTRNRQGIIVLCMDDFAGYGSGYAQIFESALSAAGVTGSWFIDGTPGGANLTALQGVVARGVLDVQMHGRTHSGWTQSGTIWTVSVPITINATIDTITDGTHTLVPYKTLPLAAIKTTMEGWGLTVTPDVKYSDTGTGVHSTLRGEVLDDISTATAVTLKTADLTGATGFFNDEISDQYDWFITTLGVTPSVAAPPGGLTNASVQTVVGAIGLKSTRSNVSAADSEKMLHNIDLMQTSYYELSTLITNNAGADEATTKSRTRAMCDIVAQGGMIQYWLAHSTSEATADQLGWIIDVIKHEYPEIMLTDAKTAVSYIRTSGLWNTSDSRTYSRTWTDQADYRLRPGSSCIKAGTPISGLTTDFAGKNWKNPPSIGAYEYYKKGGNGWGQYNYGFGW